MRIPAFEAPDSYKIWRDTADHYKTPDILDSQGLKMAVSSTMLDLGTQAPDFNLPDTDGNSVNLGSFAGKPLLVMFICNHCPYVKHVREELAKLGKEYQDKGAGIVAISSNDVANYPDDSPEKMKEEKESVGYTFPYLFDESQDVAKAYRAACTPDFYVFDSEHKLAYRGQLDDSRPNSDIPVSGKDVRAALDALLSGSNCEIEQKNSIGCNIKWKKGQEPDYF